MPSGSKENFTLIQGMRGLAALWVVLFHLQKSTAIQGLSVHLPGWFDYAVFGYGRAGVAVFFVISGFIIAHSVHGKIMTSAELGRFALRRSVRLDPPYWASMVLAITVQACLAFAHHVRATYPSPSHVAAHVFYLQELLRVPEIQIVYWTLTYEIQFYLVYAGSRWVEQRTRASGAVEWTLFGLAVWSALRGQEWALHGLFVNLWQGFYLGVLAYRAGRLNERKWHFAVLIAVTLIGLRHASEIFALPSACAAFVLFMAARTKMLSTSLQARAWQWLGAISYSLYLVHIPTIAILAGAWGRLVGRGYLQDSAAALVLTTACLLCATIFFWGIERPSHLLAKRLFRPRVTTNQGELAIASLALSPTKCSASQSVP